jgi:DtxR family manganese transport transcriptional regulator
LIDRDGTCRIVNLAERFGVSHVTVIRVVKRLEAEGLLYTQPYQPIELTEAGSKLAKTCQKRHETVYRFLRKLGVSKKVANVDAEGIEHHLSPETLSRFRAFLKDSS